MKQVQLTLLSVVVLAGMGLAQNPPQAQNPPAGQAATTTPAYKTRPMRQAQKPDEFQAYQAAAAISDPVALEKAADDFAAKYKNSELREELYLRSVNLYQVQNQIDKAIEVGRKAIATDPLDPRALVMTANLIAIHTRDTDIDRDEKLAEATKDSQLALQKLDDPGLMLPPNTPPDRVEGARRTVQAISYATLGQVDLVKENWPGAETNLRKANELSVQPDPVTLLQLALALDHQKKYPDALAVANKALDAAGNDAATASQIKSERQRLLQLTGGAAPAQQPAPAQSSATPKQ